MYKYENDHSGFFKYTDFGILNLFEFFETYNYLISIQYYDDGDIFSEIIKYNREENHTENLRKVENLLENRKWIFIECCIGTFCIVCEYLEKDLSV